MAILHKFSIFYMFKNNSPILFIFLKSARIALCAAALAAFSLHAPAAWAGRPLVTEDAAILDAGACELESYIARLGRPRLNLQWGQLGCGTGFDTQINAGAGREKTYPGHVTIAAVSGKTALRALTDQQAGVAIAYSVLGGNHVDHMRHEATEIKAVLSVPHGHWLAHANAGWVRTPSSHGGKTIWALALERRNAAGPVDLMGEIFGDDRAAPWAQLAARWTVVPDRLVFDTSIGAQFNGVHSRQATIGLKLAF